MSDRVRTFRNVRARVLTLEDGQWRPAWTKHLAHDEVRLRLKAFTPLAIGTPVQGECYGDGSLARFSGIVEAQAGQDVAIRIVGSIGFDRSPESIRIGVEGVVATLARCGTAWEILVADVSPASLGALTPLPATPSETLDLLVRSVAGEIRAQTRVLYCRSEPGPEGAHRIGLSIVEASRLDGARWTRFVEAMAHA